MNCADLVTLLKLAQLCLVKQKKVEVEAKEPHMKVTKTEDKTDSNKKADFQLMKNLTCLSIVEDYQEP